MEAASSNRYEHRRQCLTPPHRDPRRERQKAQAHSTLSRIQSPVHARPPRYRSRHRQRPRPIRRESRKVQIWVEGWLNKIHGVLYKPSRYGEAQPEYAGLSPNQGDVARHMRTRGIASPTFDLTPNDRRDLPRTPHERKSSREPSNLMQKASRQLKSLINDLQVKRLLVVLNPRPFLCICDDHAWPWWELIEPSHNGKIACLL